LECEECSADESEPDAASQMAWTVGHRSLALDALRWLPGLSTTYELWGTPDPNALADRMRERLRRVVPAADQAD
jgi:hypothetical protein